MQISTKLVSKVASTSAKYFLKKMQTSEVQCLNRVPNSKIHFLQKKQISIK